MKILQINTNDLELNVHLRAFIPFNVYTRKKGNKKIIKLINIKLMIWEGGKEGKKDVGREEGNLTDQLWKPSDTSARRHQATGAGHQARLTSFLCEPDLALCWVFTEDSVHLTVPVHLNETKGGATRDNRPLSP